MARDEPARGISLKTLAIASVASALAAYVVQAIWRPGTLIAAATTPVIVALLTEALNRPVSHVSRAGAQVTRAGQQVIERRGRRTSADPGTQPSYTVHGEARRRRRVRLAAITGLLGFVLVGGAWTGAELVSGQSLFGGDERTTYFGGGTAEEEQPPETSPAPEVTPAPTEPNTEATPSPDSEATPVPTVAPEPTVEGQATPAPQASPAPTATPAP